MSECVGSPTMHACRSVHAQVRELLHGCTDVQGTCWAHGLHGASEHVCKVLWARGVFVHVSICGSVVVPVSLRQCMSAWLRVCELCPARGFVCLHGASP